MFILFFPHFESAQCEDCWKRVTGVSPVIGYDGGTALPGASKSVFLHGGGGGCSQKETIPISLFTLSIWLVQKDKTEYLASLNESSRSVKSQLHADSFSDLSDRAVHVKYFCSDPFVTLRATSGLSDVKINENRYRGAWLIVARGHTVYKFILLSSCPST